MRRPRHQPATRTRRWPRSTYHAAAAPPRTAPNAALTFTPTPVDELRCQVNRERRDPILPPRPNERDHPYGYVFGGSPLPEALDAGRQTDPDESVRLTQIPTGEES